jgi:group I intron endonuclease
MTTVGVYKITNPQNKIYVGQSINIKERFRKYYKLNCKRQSKLYFSLKKYGPENHVFEIIEECFIEQLNEREKYWGIEFDVLGENGLNLKLGNGRGSLTDITKQKISKSMLGKKKTQEHCLNLSNAKKGIPSKRKGKPDLKQKGKPKLGAGGKGKPKLGAGPKSGNSIINIETNMVFKSIKECMICEGISKRKIFLLLKNPNSSYKYVNKNYYKNKQKF